MKRKHLRSLMGVLLAGVLALTPAGSAFVPVFGAEAGESVSENSEGSEEKEVEDIFSVSEEKTEEMPIAESENAAVSENETVSEDAANEENAEAVVSEDGIAPVTSENAFEESAGADNYVEAVWDDYDCLLNRSTKELSLLSYNGADRAEFIVPATADNIKIKNGDGTLSDYDQQCSVCLGDPEKKRGVYSIWFITKEGLASTGKVTISQDVKFNKYVNYLFSGLSDISLGKVDTSNVEDMSGMFSLCSGLETLDLTSFNTSKVTDMSYMFSQCNYLDGIDLSKFDTSNVTDMSGMFDEYASSVRYPSDLDLKSFNTSKVTNMRGMFAGCGAEVLFGNFDTSNVTDMSCMFADAIYSDDRHGAIGGSYGSIAVDSLDLKKLNTSKVVNMNSMFRGTEISKLDFSNFNTSKVIDMGSMFCGSSGKTNLDLRSFDTSNVRYMDSMFEESGLETIDVSSFNTSKVLRMNYMFSDPELRSININGFVTSKVTDMSSMFGGCSKLTVLDLSNLDTSQVSDFSGMFSGCSGLSSIDVSKFDTSHAVDMSSMFSGCNIETIDTSRFETSGVKCFNDMFSGCSNLTTISGNISNFSGDSLFNTRIVGLGYKYASTSGMFSGCSKLKIVDMRGFSYWYDSDLNESWWNGNELDGCASLEKIVFPDKLETLSVQTISGSIYVPSTLTSVSFTDALGGKDITVYGPETIRSTVEALDDEETGTATFINISEDNPYSGEKVYATGISIDQKNVTLYYDPSTGVGTSCTLTAKVTPENVTNKNIYWGGGSTAGFAYGHWEKRVVDIEPYDVKSGQVVITAYDTTDSEKPGYVWVKSGDGRVSAACAVTVKYKSQAPQEVKVTGVTLDKNNASVGVGGTLKLNATVYPADAANKDVIWTTSDNSIADVDSNGNVTGKAVGNTVITVKTKDGDHTASCTVTVTEPKPDPKPEPQPEDNTYYVAFVNEGVYFDSFRVNDGETSPMPEKTPVSKISGNEFVGWADEGGLWNFSTPIHENTVLNAKYVLRTPEAVSANTGSGMDPVAKVSGKYIYLVKGQVYTAGTSGWEIKSGGGISLVKNTGKITAKKKGNYLVEHNGEQYTVAVADPSFSKYAKKRSVLIGEKDGITLTINPASDDQKSNYNVTWTSANPMIATVDNGVITGVGKGTTKINAHLGGKTYSATVTVSDTYKAPGKQKGNYSKFSMNPLQSFNLNFDTKKAFTVKGATWEDEDGGMIATSDNRGRPDGGYKNRVVSITKAGKITAIGSGETHLIGTDNTKDKRRVDVYITVKDTSSRGIVYIVKNKTKAVKIPFVNSNKANWTSSDTKVVGDCKKGKLKGTGVGKSTVTCSYNGFEFNTLAYVEDPDLEIKAGDDKLKKNGNKYEMKLKVGDIYNRVTMKNTSQTVYFTSSKPAVAFIDENGVVYARSKGKTNISTKVNGKTIKIAVTVE